MRRREFLGLVGGAVIPWPLAARAQQVTKIPRIGLLTPGRADSSDASLKTLDAFIPALRELGYTEGLNIAIERKFGEGNADRLRALATELVEAQVDAIVAKIAGACLCGLISYEAEADPEMTGICHCTDCQIQSGSAFRSVVPSRQGSFKLRSGEPKIYVKTAESGTKRELAFCPNCGTPIYSSTVDDGPKVHSIRVGTLHQRKEFVPKLQYWFRSAQRWTDDLGSVPKTEKQR